MNIKEKGYTLVEMLVSLAITGIIFSTVGSAVYQMSTVSGYGNDLLTADHELQNTAYWFNLDGQSALAVSAPAAAADALTYTLPDNRTVTYSLKGANLLRTDGSTQITLAQNISSLSFSIDDRLVSLKLTSSPAGRAKVSEQRNYQVYLRSAGP